jgi:hypothetical protein
VKRSFAVVALLIGASAYGDQCSTVNDRELSLGGIVVGTAEYAVLARFGQPVRTPGGGYRDVRLEYPGLSIRIGEGHRVSEITSTSGQYCTPAGLCPGMDFEEARARYGTPRIVHRDEGSFLEYPSFNPRCRMQIVVRDRLVRSVRAACWPLESIAPQGYGVGRQPVH